MYETVRSHTDAARYAMLWDRREQRLRAASRAGQLDVVLDPLPEDLALVRGIAVPSANDDIARYYGFRSAKEDASHQPSAEPWTQEAWTKLRPEYLPDAIRNFLRRILKMNLRHSSTRSGRHGDLAAVGDQDRGSVSACL